MRESALRTRETGVITQPVTANEGHLSDAHYMPKGTDLSKFSEEFALESSDLAGEARDLSISRIGLLASRGSSECSLGAAVALLTPRGDERGVETLAT